MEPYAPYLPFVGWPVIWVLPYGWWTWAIVFAPDAFAWLWRRARRSRPGLAVSARRAAAGVAFVDESGAIVEELRDSDVEAVTRMIDADGVTSCLRVGRRGGRDLLFDAPSEEACNDIARQLGLDLEKARGRYRAGSRAVPLALLVFIGFAIIAWSFVSPPDDAQVAALLSHYTRFVTLPLIVLFAIPTWVDVGADGVGWRWLFLRRYLPFSAIAAVEPIQRGSRPSAVRLTTIDGPKHVVWLTKESEALAEHVRDAFVAARMQAGTPNVDANLARNAGETILSWLRRLRGMRRNAGAYRGASTEHLWRVAEEANAPLDDRVAALVVLTSTESARDRARTIAARVVSPPARAMFEAIADETGDERLAQSLEPLLEEQKRAV